MAKIYGNIFANPGDKEQPLVFVPTDGSNAELRLFNEIPEATQKLLSEMADKLDLVPLGMIVDII